MTYSLITPTEATNFELATNEKLGRGATADVFKKEINGKNFAIKIYKNPQSANWSKINLLTELGQKEDYEFVKNHAWPIGIVQKNGQNVGFAMQLFDLNLFKTIDNYYDNILRPNIREKHLLAIPNLVLIAKNLSIIVDRLHSKNIFLIDLKPQNIVINTTTNEVVLLDCDGFSVEYKNDKFPANLVSADYIAPEVTVNRLSPTVLGLGQDLYALSVLIFQLFNRGLHPFSGRLQIDLEATTNDDKAAAGYYAYGMEANPDIHPHTASFHEMWPDEVRSTFELCFIGNKRASASEWVDVFQNIETSMGYVRCESHPEDAQHIKFRDKDCMQCHIDGLQVTHSQTEKSPWKQSKVHSYTPPSPPPPKSSKGPLIFVLLFLGLIYLIHLINSNSSTSTTSITNQQNTSEFRVAASCASENLSGCSDLKICAMATDKINNITKWSLFESDKPYVTEAKRRNLLCGVSRRTNSSVESCNNNNTANCSDREICEKATVFGSDRWAGNSFLLPFVDEAKRRNLTCGISEKVSKVQKECSGADPSGCSFLQLCDKATTIQKGKKVWNPFSTKKLCKSG